MDEFIQKLKDALQTDADISMDTKLDDLDEWDSLGMMTTAVFLEKDYGYKVTVVDLLEFLTVEELYKKVHDVHNS